MSTLVDNVIHRLPVGGEFQGYHGDCVEYALMVARGAVTPSAPISGDELNRLTSESIRANEAGSAGQMTDANLVWLCSAEHIPYGQLPYDLNSLYYWLSVPNAVVCGFSNGQALPGNEQGVFGHAVAILAHDASGFTLANGDSVNGRAGKLDTGVTSDQLAAAHPTTLTVIKPAASAPANLAGIATAADNIAIAAQHILTDTQTIHAMLKGQ